MADPGGEKEYGRAQDQIAAANHPKNDETVASDLERVQTEKELHENTQVDTEYAKEMHEQHHQHQTSSLGESSSQDSGLDLVKTKSQAQTLRFKEGSWKRWLTLRSRHIPPVPKERAISGEASAGILSQYSFQWMQPIMYVGYQRTLEPNDIWLVNPKRSADTLATKLEQNFKKRVDSGAKSPLLKALYDTLKFEFLLGAVCQFVSAIIQVLNPFILRYLITFAAEAYDAVNYGTPAPNLGHGIGLVFCITILQTIQSGCTNQFLYRGMINGGSARAALISLIFDKSMKISGRARAGDIEPDADMRLPAGITPGSKEEQKWMKMKLKEKNKKEKAAKKAKKNAKGPPKSEDGGWSNGRIVNLMSTDTYRVDQASGMFHMTWTAPIQLVITLILLLINISYSALAGYALIVIMMPLLGASIKSLFKRRKTINKITDQRVSLTQEILGAVRFVKYFGWETSFLERIEAIRRKEIRSIQLLMAIRNAINAISMSIPIFASMLAFITYSLTDHGLNPAYVFSSLALFNSIRIPLNLLPLVIGQVVDAASSVGRIEEFLLAEETKDEAVVDLSAVEAIHVEGGAFSWEKAKPKADESTPRSKKEMKQDKKDADKQAKEDKAAGIAAPSSEEATAARDAAIDSEKTLAAGQSEEVPFNISDLNFSIARNELVAVIGGVGSGKSSLLAALAGDMRKTEGKFTMGASRAFCPQYAWIQNATLQENILFGKPMKEAWYNKVLDACALRPDLEMLPNGDQTEIGERGITVSGGQKQRLNIARAIYFDSDIVLMDDPLSAVDAHVGRHLLDEAICGLLANKCRVLATHQLWVLNRCDRIIWMDEGRIQAIGTFDELMNNNAGFVKLIANNSQEEKAEQEGQVNEDEIEEEKKEEKKHENGKKGGAALMSVEERATKGVSGSVYLAYVRASGSIAVLPLLFLLLVLSQGSSIVTNLWLSYWTSNKFGMSTGAYIGIYAALGVAQAVLMFAFSVALSIYGTTASRVMLHRAVTHVLRAPMSFFDTTPLGRITNRFSKDVDTMDNVLSDAIRFFCMTMGMIVSVFILIIVYYYFFVVALAPLLVIFVFSASYYRSSAREIKRHEAVLRSGVFAKFSEAVNGIATIRAYGMQKHFSDNIRGALDEMNGAYFLTFANQRWLSVRLDFIGNLLVFVVGILVVTSRFTVGPSTGGLVLSYILSIVQMIQFTVRQLAEVENNMNATERIHYYGTQLEQEPPLHDAKVDPSWPAHGEIVFDNVQMRYRDGLPLVLKGLSMHVRAGERIGVVGRTGAGKSTIMSTLFRLTELSGGSITIDGVNINTVGLADLRSHLAIIPQDPTLFKGTIRSNLDPFNRYTDLELWSALRQADLVGAEQQLGDKSARIHLDSNVEEEGLNFSLGQRQLMALARALVRGAQIIVCDEATSSVDMETDQKVQKTMRLGFEGKTVLCIAHRLKTIIHYDRILVMAGGQVEELDTPLALYERGGTFRGMCDRSNIRREDFERGDDF